MAYYLRGCTAAGRWCILEASKDDELRRWHLPAADR
jgi:hypothetical protein